MHKRILQVGLALFFVSVCFLLAALQIPHIGIGAPDWHTVKRPEIPVQSATEEDQVELPVLVDCGDTSKPHPDIVLLVVMKVCVAEPVYGWSLDAQQNKWVRACVGNRAVSKYVKKQVKASWIDTINCYAFYDDYGRLRLVPEYR